MTVVKVCGVTRLEDAMLAANLGARAIGFVFWSDSPRFIDPFRARKIVASLPPFVTPVGVFVNQPLEYVQGVSSLLRLGAIQLHGDETPDDYRGIMQPILKSISLGSGLEAEAIEKLPPRVTVLLDAHDPERRGGTGRVIDWRAARAVAASRRTMLSGGLNAENVSEAMTVVRPFGIDVSSGLESAPGVKDARRMREFFMALARFVETTA